MPNLTVTRAGHFPVSTQWAFHSRKRATPLKYLGRSLLSLGHSSEIYRLQAKAWFTAIVNLRVAVRTEKSAVYIPFSGTVCSWNSFSEGTNPKSRSLFTLKWHNNKLTYRFQTRSFTTRNTFARESTPNFLFCLFYLILCIKTLSFLFTVANDL